MAHVKTGIFCVIFLNVSIWFHHDRHRCHPPAHHWAAGHMRSEGCGCWVQRAAAACHPMQAITSLYPRAFFDCFPAALSSGLPYPSSLSRSCLEPCTPLFASDQPAGGSLQGNRCATSRVYQTISVICCHAASRQRNVILPLQMERTHTHHTYTGLPESGDHGFPADSLLPGFSCSLASGNFAYPLLLVQVRRLFLFWSGDRVPSFSR